jgi:hypothetical protein
MLAVILDNRAVRTAFSLGRCAIRKCVEVPYKASRGRTTTFVTAVV